MDITKTQAAGLARLMCTEDPIWMGTKREKVMRALELLEDIEIDEIATHQELTSIETAKRALRQLEKRWGLCP